MQIPDSVVEIAHSMHGQNNYCTSYPIYTIQKAIRIYGINDDYRVDGVGYVNEDKDLHFDSLEELEEFLESSDNEENLGLDDFEGINYQIVYQTVNFFFSEKAAMEWLSNKSSDYRLDVISAFFNPEIRAIQEMLDSINEGS
ncbi:hypothetical protein I926_03955 [Pasteurella multocida subsp. multocida OH4807]|nr:hypothetical protein I926_03955 [Pasteurella multocida subsp. multocida OH4807]